MNDELEKKITTTIKLKKKTLREIRITIITESDGRYKSEKLNLSSMLIKCFKYCKDNNLIKEALKWKEKTL